MPIPIPPTTNFIGDPIGLKRVAAGFNETQGAYTTAVWEGSAESVYSGYLTFLRQPSTIDVTIEQVGSQLWRLTLQQDDAPSLVVPDEGLRMATNVVQKDLLVPPFDTPGMKALSDADITLIRNKWRTNQVGDNAPDFSEASTSANKATLTSLWSLLSRGVRSKTVYQPILTRTTSQHSRVSFNNSYDNVGSIISPSAISQDADISGSIISWNLPQAGEAYAGYNWGWLKMGPNVEEGSNRTIILNQEWQWGLWPELLYTFLS